MARAGDVLVNPSTGERVTFLQTAADTGGELVQYDLEFIPRGFVAREHLHPSQEENHEVLEGPIGLVVDGNERRLEAGNAVLVPPRTPHRLVRLREEPVKVRFTLRPAFETEVLLETFFGLARDGKVGKNGDPPLLQLAVISREFPELGRPVKPPPAVQRAILAPLAVLGRARGYRARYPEYSS
jgi:quercetin dioxygenase-like cupin family protein